MYPVSVIERAIVEDQEAEYLATAATPTSCRRRCITVRLARRSDSEGPKRRQLAAADVRGDYATSETALVFLGVGRGTGDEAPSWMGSR